MYCNIISATENWTLWGIKSRKNWTESLADGIDGLFDIAATNDIVLMDCLDKFGYLKITGFDAQNRKVLFEITDVQDWDLKNIAEKSVKTDLF